MKEQPLVTIFTCTYNMANKLPFLASSVVEQTYSNFYWLIIDDGSSDNTETTVANLKEKYTKLKIEYVKLPHGTKPAALNYAFKNVQGKYSLQIDADDELVPQALEILVNTFENIPEKDRSKYWKVEHNVIDSATGKIVGRPFPKYANFNHFTQQWLAFHKQGEKNHLMQNDIIKNFEFPLFKGAIHVADITVWYACQLQYRSWFINDALRIYHQDEMQVGRLSNSSCATKSRILGTYKGFQFLINNYFPYHRLRYVLTYCKLIISCTANGLKCGDSLTNVNKNFTHKVEKFWSTFLFPIAYFHFKRSGGVAIDDLNN
ncbi:MAG: glycosyltransferase family A protein [Oscillospiraceae bacterium]